MHRDWDRSCGSESSVSEGTSVCKDHDWMVLGLVDRGKEEARLRCRSNQRLCCASWLGRG